MVHFPPACIEVLLVAGAAFLAVMAGIATLAEAPSNVRAARIRAWLLAALAAGGIGGLAYGWPRTGYLGSWHVATVLGTGLLLSAAGLLLLQLMHRRSLPASVACAVLAIGCFILGLCAFAWAPCAAGAITLYPEMK